MNDPIELAAFDDPITDELAVSTDDWKSDFAELAYVLGG
jgi:hypothetical protein